MPELTDLQTTTCCYYATTHEESCRVLAETCLEQGMCC